MLTKQELVALLEKHGTLAAASRASGIPRPTLSRWHSRYQLPAQRSGRPAAPEAQTGISITLPDTLLAEIDASPGRSRSDSIRRLVRIGLAHEE